MTLNLLNIFAVSFVGSVAAHARGRAARAGGVHRRGDAAPDSSREVMPKPAVRPRRAEEPAPHTLVLESHSRKVLGHERRAIESVIGSLGRRAIHGDALAALLDAAFGRRPSEVSEVRRQALLTSLKDAAQATYLGDWERATRLLTWVRRELSDDVLGQARQRPLFDALQQARILLAECHARTNRRDQAWLLMEEALRAQPDLSLSPTIYGPVLQALHFRVRTQLELGRASLRVETSPPGALIFLSGRYVGISPILLAGLYQGTSELLALQGTRASRVRRVRLGSSLTHVMIDLPGEAPLRTGREVGLVLPRGPGREAIESRWAQEIGRRLGYNRLILLGVQERQGRRALVGRILLGRPSRTRALAYVFLEPDLPSRDALRRLGDFLMHGASPGRGVEVVGQGGRVASRAALGRISQGKDRALWISGWTLLGLGLATSSAGGVALGLDGRTEQEASATQNRMVYQTGRLGYGLLGGGLGVALLGATLLVVDAIRAPSAMRPAPRTNRTLGLGTDGRSVLLSFGGEI